jgi:hypothetical protein
LIIAGHAYSSPHRFPLSVPLIMVLGTAAFIDRAVRTESIFDSSSMVSAILATHALNVFRSDPENHQLYLTASSASLSSLGKLAQVFFPARSLSLLLFQV